MALLLVGLLLAAPQMGYAWFLFSPVSADESSGVSLVASSAQDMPLLSPIIAMISDRKPIDEQLEGIQAVEGETLTPDIGIYSTLSDYVDIPADDTISTYIVQSGDTVAKVAGRFGVSENTVRWANNLAPKDVLRVGQSLVILPITGVKHKIQKGDTLATVASKYKADKREILEYNGITETTLLQIGDILIIPDGEITSVVTANKTTAKVPTGSAVAKTGVSASRGYYIQPVVPDGGRIRKTQGFHTRYNAIDVGAPVGTPIRAMADGVVLITKSPNYYNGGYGGLTIVSHSNGSQTLYAHQSRILVKPGQRVSQGETIGYTGNTGKSTGPHLHFEIRGVYPTPVLY